MTRGAEKEMRHLKNKWTTPLLMAAILSLLCITPQLAHAGATILIVNSDGANEGFNDPSSPDPASTNGGNNGATLGEQRLNAFQFAADIWGAMINKFLSKMTFIFVSNILNALVDIANQMTPARVCP